VPFSPKTTKLSQFSLADFHPKEQNFSQTQTSKGSNKTHKMERRLRVFGCIHAHLCTATCKQNSKQSKQVTVWHSPKPKQVWEMDREVSESSLVSPRPTGAQGTSRHAGATRTDPWGAAAQRANVDSGCGDCSRLERSAERSPGWRIWRSTRPAENQSGVEELVDDSGSVPGREAPATAREERRHVRGLWIFIFIFIRGDRGLEGKKGRQMLLGLGGFRGNGLPHRPSR